MERATAGAEKKRDAVRQPRRFHLINTIKFWGGGERFIFDLACGLREKNFDVRIYGRPGKALLRRTAAAGLPSVPLDLIFDYNPLPLLKFPPFSGKESFVAVTPRDLKLLRLLAYLRPHAQFFWWLGVCYPVDNWEYRWLLKNENIRLIAVCDFLKSEILSRTPQVAGRISVLPTGVEIPAVDTAAARQKLAEKYRIGPQKLFLGIFSRLVPGKGHSMLFQSLERVKNQCGNFHLWISHDGDREKLQKEAVDLGLGGCTSFIGNQDAILPWMAGVDVVLLPSEMECFPYAVLEAMALGKAVLASQVGGLAEMVESGRDGVLLPPKEPQAWARAIIDLTQDFQRREALGRAALQSVRKKFSLERMVSGFLEIVDADSAIGRA